MSRFAVGGPEQARAMETVPIDAIDPARLTPLLAPERAERLLRGTERARRILDGRTLWHVNATASGGGVAEMLQALLAYSQGAGIDTRWCVLDGSPEFFALTKRLHNLLHGTAGDAGPTGEEERSLFEEVLTADVEWLQEQVSPGDVVVLHDPQTVAMAAGLRAAGASMVWRCHIGRDELNDETDRGWAFLRPYAEQADVLVFSRRAYAPDWVDPERLVVIPPSLDPFSPKNCDLTPAQVQASLRAAGLLAAGQDSPGDDTGADPDLEFDRRDGSRGRQRRHDDLVVRGGPVPAGARTVLQVSRWDRLKDMTGVLEGFCHVLPELPEDLHLCLVGPAVTGVSDDPEGAEVLEECTEVYDRLPPEPQKRIHLMSLPMDDIDENAHLVNALHRQATVVVQKSLVEGFGLTVTEPMWKARPVLASRVGGIQDQVVDGESGVLLDDPTDLAAFGRELLALVGDPARCKRIGAAARERVREHFLGDRHLLQYVDLFDRLVADH